MTEFTSQGIRRILSQASAFVAIHDREGRILWSNKFGYGYDPSILGATDDAILEEDRPAWWSAFSRAMAGASDVPYTVRIKTHSPPGWARLVGRLSGVSIDDAIRYVVAVVYDESQFPRLPCANCTSGRGESRLPSRQLITLSEMARLVHRKACTLRKCPGLPPPVEGGRKGQRSLWVYSEVRGWLERQFGTRLPAEPFD